MTAAQSITLDNLTAAGLRGANGGVLTLTTTSGSINLTNGASVATDSSSSTGNAGMMVMTSGNALNISGSMLADAYGTGKYAGVINLTATNNITSSGNIYARGLQATGSGYATGGGISLTSTAGGIALNSGASLNTSSAGESSGGIGLFAGGAAGIIVPTNILASGSGDSNYGGSVMIKASAGSVTVGSIDARGLNGAFSGAVMIGAAGSILAGSSDSVQGISTQGTAGSTAIIIGAAQGIANNAGGFLNLNASSSNGRAGSVYVAAGGNNGTASLALGNINTTGITGGDVEIVSMDTSNMSATVGGISTNASGAQALSGSVGIAVRGALTVGGVINTTNTSVAASSPARSGSVFLSSATSIGYSSINAWNSLNGSASGTVILVSAGNGSSITPNPTANPSPPPSFLPANVTVASGMSAVYTSVPTTATISGAKTVTITTTALTNYNPNGYASINSSTVTLDTGSDSRMIAPLMSLSTATNTDYAVLHSTSADSITVVARNGISMGNTLIASGTTSGGSVNFLSLTSDVTMNGTMWMVANGGNVGGNMSLLAPLGQIFYNSFATSSFNVSGTQQAGNMVAAGGTGVTLSGETNASSNQVAGNVTLIAGLGNIVNNNPGGAGSAYFINVDSVNAQSGNVNLIVGKSVYNSSQQSEGIFQMQGVAAVSASTTSGQAGTIRFAVVTGNNTSSGLGCCGIAGARINLNATGVTGIGGDVTISVGGTDQSWRVTTTSGTSAGFIESYAAGSLIIGSLFGASPLAGNFVANSTVDRAGDISITSATGNITNCYLCTSATSCSSCAVIEAKGGLFGGDITLNASQGNLNWFYNSTFQALNTSASYQAGDVNLSSYGNTIMGSGINTSSQLNGGDVTAGVSNGNFYISIGLTNLGARYITTQGDTGASGDINILVGKSILDSGLNAGIVSGNQFTNGPCTLPCYEGSYNASSAYGKAGNINIAVNDGLLGSTHVNLQNVTLQLLATSTSGNGGNITVTSNGNQKYIWNMSSSGVSAGDITINAGSGTFTNTNGVIQANASSGLAGDVSITATSVATVSTFGSNGSYIEARGGAFGGDIQLVATTGTISITGTTNSRNNIIDASGNIHGGNVGLTAFGDISLSSQVDTSSGVTGGDIDINITGLGNLNLNGSGGSGASSTWKFMDARGGAGNGGNVSININQSNLPGSGNGFAGVHSALTGFGTEASINTSSTSGNAGDISINILNGPLGYFGTATPNSDYLQLIANSTNNNAGSIALSVGGNIATNWIYTANGQEGGTIALVSGGSFVSGSGNGSGVFNANGTAGGGGNIILSAANGVSAVSTSATGTTSGGTIAMLSSQATATLTTITATGTLQGGTILGLAKTGVSYTTANASSSQGAGGSILFNAYGTNANITGTTTNASGVTGGGSVSLIASGTVPVSATVAASGAGASGGSIFVSRGASSSLTFSPNVNGGAGGSVGTAIIVSAGNITGVPGSGVYQFANINSGTSSLLTEAYVNAHSSNNYAYTVSTTSAPTITDTTTSTTFVVPAGSLSTFTSFGIGNLTVDMPSASFLAPLLVGGTVSANNVAGGGDNLISLVSAGNMTIAGNVSNSAATGNASDVLLVSGGTLSVGGTITTNSTQAASTASGNVTLLGNIVNTAGINMAGGGTNTTGGTLVGLAWGTGATAITIGNIIANSTGIAVGGTVDLASPFSSMTLSSISAYAYGAVGGNVFLDGEGISVTGTTGNTNGSAIDVSSTASNGGEVVISGTTITVSSGSIVASGASGGNISLSVNESAMTVQDVISTGSGFTQNQPNHGGVISITGFDTGINVSVNRVSAAGLTGAAAGQVSILNPYGSVTAYSVDTSSTGNFASNITLNGESIAITGTVNNANSTAGLDISSGTSSGGGLVAVAFGGGLNIANDIAAYGTGSQNAAGNVVLASTGGTLSVGNINAVGSSSARGAQVILSNGDGSITIGRTTADTQGVIGLNASGASAGGNVVINAGTYVSGNGAALLNINTSSTSGFGGSVNIVSAGNDGNVSPKSISVNNIVTSGTVGGKVTIVNIDDAARVGDMPQAGSVTINSINSQASGSANVGGSIGISSTGAITVTSTVVTSNNSVAPVSGAAGGSVFMSAEGVISICSGCANGMPAVSNAGTTSGNIVLYGAENIIVGTTTYTTETHPASNIGIFPNVNVATTTTLSGNTTLTITPTTVSNSLVPGGFASISLPSNSLTINTGGDGHFNAPIAAVLSGISVNSLSGQQVSNNASSISLASRFAINVGTNVVAQAGVAGNGGDLTLLASQGSLTVGTYIELGGDTATGTTTGGSALLIAPTAVLSVNGANSGVTISTRAGRLGGNVLAISGLGANFNSEIFTGQTAQAGDVIVVAPVGNIAFTTNNGGVCIEASSTSAVAGFVSLNVGLGQGNGLVMAGSIRALSNATTGGTVQIRLQQGNVDTTGALSIDASSGSSNPADFGGNVLISSPGDVNIDNWSINANGPNGGTITISSSGTIQLNADNMQANATDVLTGVGGTIEFVSSSSTNLVVGSATGTNYIDGTISIAGVSGGTVSITNRQGAVLIPNFGTAIDITSGISANGANLNLSGTRLQVDNATGGIINMSGAGTGNGGNISLISSDPLTQMVIGSATGTNFVNATLQAASGMAVGSIGDGGTITVSSAAGLSAVATAFDVSAARHGGTITINTNTSNVLTVDNATPGSNTIVGVLTARGGSLGGTGDGGIIVLNNQAGGVSINQNNIDVSVQAANGKGGEVYLTGSLVTVGGGLTVNGAGTGDGGIILITSDASLQTGFPTAGNSSITGNLSANAGTSGLGGTVQVFADGDITVSTSTISAQAAGNGIGGNVELEGNSLTFVGAGAISVNGAGTGNGGFINLVSSSATAGLTVGGNLSALPGTGAIGTTNGGVIDIDVASGTISNAFTIQTNDGGAGTAGSGGQITFRTQVAADLNLTNTGSILAVGNGTGPTTITFNSTTGSVNINDALNLNGDIATSATGTIDFGNAAAGSVSAFADNMTGRIRVFQGTNATLGANSSLNLFTSAVTNNFTANSTAGGISLTGNVTSSGLAGTVTLGAGTDILGTGLVTGNSLVLTSTGGNIGGGTSTRINTATTTMDITSSAVGAGLGNAFINQTGALTLNGANVDVNKTFDLVASDAITVSNTGTVTAGSVSLNATSNGITLNGGITANAVGGTLVLLSATDISGAGLLTGAGVDLTATAGNIGTGGQRVNTAAGTLSLNANDAGAANGNAFINQTGALGLSSTSVTVDKTLDVIASDTITTSGAGTVTADVINLATTANNIVLNGALNGASGVSLDANGAITVNASATTTGTMTVQAGGDISNGLSGGTLTGANIDLGSGGSIGTGTTSRISADTTALTAVAVGNVFVGTTGGVDLGDSSSGIAGTFDLATAAGGGININGAVGLTGGTVNLSANGAGAIGTTGTALITATDANLTSGTGAIGTGTGSRVNMSVGDTLTANTGGDVFITAVSGTNNVNLGASTAGAAGTFDLASTAATTLTAVDSLSAGNVNLTATGTGNVVTTLGAATMAASQGAVNLVANGGNVQLNSGTVNAATDITVTGQTGVSLGTAGAMSMQAGSVDVGLDIVSTDMNAYQTNEMNFGSINVTSVNAGTNITFDAANTVYLVSVGQDININSAQDVTLGANTELFAQGANVILNATDGVLNMPSGAIVGSVARFVTGGGTVVIDNQDVSVFQGGGIAIWSGPAPAGGFDAYLNNLQLNRIAGTNTPTIIGTVNYSATTTFDFTGGGSILLDSGAKGSITITGTNLFQTNGGVIAIDPPGPMVLNNVFIGVFGPLLVPVVPPAPPAPGGAAPVVADAGGVVFVEPEVSPTLVNQTSMVVTDSTSSSNTKSTLSSTVQHTVCTVMALPGGESTTDENGWVVASGYCQPFSFAGDDGTVIIGSGGTTFAPSVNHTVILKAGKMVASAGQGGLIVETAQGNITIPSDGTTIVEQDRPGVVRVANLLGGETKISMQVNGETKELKAAAGEELIVADADLSEEELIPVDGVDREPLDAGKIVGLQVKKSKFERKAMIGRDMLINCNMGCFSITMRKTIDKLKQEIGNDAVPPKMSRSPKQDAPAKIGNGAPAAPVSGKISSAPASKATETSPIVPIAYTTGSNAIIGSALRSLATDTAMIKETRGTKLVMEKPGVVNLRGGEALVAASRATLVRTGDSLVSVAPGTIALVSNENNIVKVRCLYDNSAHSVKLYAGSKLMTLSSGEEFIIGAPDESINTALKSDPLGRRKIQRYDLNKDISLLHTEFSLVSLMQNNLILGELLKAADADDHAMAEKLVKMAAVLTQVTARHGAYSATGQ